MRTCAAKSRSMGVEGFFSFGARKCAALFLFLLPCLAPAHPGLIDPLFPAAVVPNAAISDMLVDRNGKVIIAGTFTNVNGVARNHLARLDASGALDSSFDPGTGPDSRFAL